MNEARSIAVETSDRLDDSIDWARRVLYELANSLSDAAHVERDVLAEGRSLSLVLAPGTAPARRH